ncbi:hypothetical protein [Micromonospora sp. WMMD1274]|uniref:hypothetical protein n=1 Tax=Micromonospora sp. WMMD1274 TaxID=3404116 RepID=UPI003B953A87
MTHLTLTARRQRVALLGGSLVLVLLTACHADPRPAGTAPAAPRPASTPAAAATVAGLTAQQRLNLLADTISTAPADTTDGLPYTYLHLQSWARASTTIVRTDVRRWRHADGSGREIIRWAPDLHGLNHQSTPQEHQEFSRAVPHTLHHGIGDLHPHLPGDIPANPRELIRLLAPPALADEPAYPRILTSGIVELTTSQHLNPRQRVTTLRALAAAPTSPTKARQPTSPAGPACPSRSSPTDPPRCCSSTRTPATCSPRPNKSTADAGPACTPTPSCWPTPAPAALTCPPHLPRPQR